MFVSPSEESKLDRSQRYHSPINTGNAFLVWTVFAVLMGYLWAEHPPVAYIYYSRTFRGDLGRRTCPAIEGAALKPDEVPGFIVLVGVPSTKILSGAAAFNPRLHPP